MDIKYQDFYNNILLPFEKRVTDLKEKTNNYKKIELAAKGSSNFALDLNDDLFNRINSECEKIKNVDLVLNDTLLLEKIRNDFERFEKIYKKTLFEMDAMLKEEISKPFWNIEIENVIYGFESILFSVVAQFAEKQDIGNLKNNISDIDAMKLNLENKLSEYKKTIDEKNNSLKELEIKLTQVVADRDILSLRDFYKNREKEKIIEKNVNMGFYYFSFCILLGIIIFLLLDVLKLNILIKPNMENLGIFHILVYMLITSTTGLVSFLMMDFRKRLNIAKSILDEIEQIIVIINSYSVLLEKKKNVSKENQNKYELDLIATVFQHILAVKNYGYSKKEMQKNSNNNLIFELINKAVEKLK